MILKIIRNTFFSLLLFIYHFLSFKKIERSSDSSQTQTNPRPSNMWANFFLPFPQKLESKKKKFIY